MLFCADVHSWEKMKDSVSGLSVTTVGKGGANSSTGLPVLSGRNIRRKSGIRAMPI
jgi:hypothetical protein